ncbi:ABC transporter ATP-binding protein [Streptomyces olivaceus]|uniref:ABC transporter ATP-binding protein n=1 Tax=Streptomyces olivaceus TaxID=47716 RepID=UPI001CCE2629|nr:ATP-binding cassette domain-containing protein [Streptomyces olivaceus]MBZ6202384.1 ATP-binding cassette domain-containing protein [Streptomyces olivaceus]
MTHSHRDPLLDVPELSARADGAERPLLDDVALSVRAGAVAAVVGPSGSGKTTLGLAVLGASRAGVRLSGRALLSGTDLLALAPHRRPGARAGLAAHLPQHPETVLDPVRRCGGALTGLAALGHPDRVTRRRAAQDALAAAGLDWETVRRRFPHQLSGGQQQRLALASALVTGARLLVLDEPTSGLDPALATALGHRLRALADEGTGILLLSHDLPLVRAAADHVVVLEHGRCVDHGPAPDVLGPAARTPRHRATRELLAAEAGAGAGTRPAPAAPAPQPCAGIAAEGVVVRHRSGDPLPGPVSLAFPPGGRTALLGPSGSGKTTFGRVLAGLTAPSAGTVRHDGRVLPRRVDRRPAAQRRAVQYVHQSSAASFEHHRPVLPQLADTARLLRHRERSAATAEALSAAAALGLDEELLRRTPARLSGGQLQRCALVRALLARPALLVCDEVTSALDTVSRRRVVEALPELLAPDRTALLFISHDLPAVRALTDDAVLFEAGRCVRRGTVDEVLPAGWRPAPAVRDG